ncbi:hypothetical protein HY025_01155 [Candidatus Daviesbacteria bacterium]|nr:hypothetical protein [Candidatus Daviesbacteria bacterium]
MSRELLPEEFPRHLAMLSKGARIIQERENVLPHPGLHYLQLGVGTFRLLVSSADPITREPLLGFTHGLLDKARGLIRPNSFQFAEATHFLGLTDLGIAVWSRSRKVADRSVKLLREAASHSSVADLEELGLIDFSTKVVGAESLQEILQDELVEPDEKLAERLTTTPFDISEFINWTTRERTKHISEWRAVIEKERSPRIKKLQLELFNQMVADESSED